MTGRTVIRGRNTTRGGSLFNWAFNQNHDSEEEPDSPQYFYKRTDSARRSFAMRFGDAFNSQISMGSVDEQDHIDVYLKATTSSCIQNLIAVSVGRGLLDLPLAVAFCGYIPSLVYMILLAVCVIFFMHRTVEAPQVVRKSMGFFEDIALEVLGKKWWRLIATCNVVGLFAYLVQVFEHEMHALGKQLLFIKIGNYDDAQVGMFEMLCLVPLLVLILLPFASRTSAKALHYNSIVSVFVLRVIVAVLCGLLLWCAWKDWGSHQYEAVNIDVGCQLKGFQMFVYAFLGPMLLPSILADMHNPEHAKRVVNKAVGEMCLMYIFVAYLGYFSLSTEDGKLFSGLNLFTAIARRGNFFTRVCRVLFTAKNFTTFPLIFSPWRRLIESFFSWEAVPQMELNTPWALQQLMRWKTFVRYALLLSIALSYLILRLQKEKNLAFQIFYKLGLCFPFVTCMFFFPAFFTATLWTQSYESNDAMPLDDEASASFFFRSSFTFTNAGHRRTSTDCTLHSSIASKRPVKSMAGKSMAGKSMAMGYKMPKIDIDLPKKMIRDEERKKRRLLAGTGYLWKRFHGFAHLLTEECSLIEPAWAKTRTGNVLIFGSCCIGIAIWAAMVVDIFDDLWFTEPSKRAQMALG